MLVWVLRCFRYKHHCVVTHFCSLARTPVPLLSVEPLLLLRCCFFYFLLLLFASLHNTNTNALGRYVSPFVMLIVKTTHWTAIPALAISVEPQCEQTKSRHRHYVCVCMHVSESVPMWLCVYVEKIAVKCCKVTTVYIRSWIAEESTRVFKFLGVFSLNGLTTSNWFHVCVSRSKTNLVFF